MAPIYLDYCATTPLDPRVFEAMKPFFLEQFGNAGSRTHLYGQRAKDKVERARQDVADLLGARPEEVVFTSGATESNNIVLLGLLRHGKETGRRHILATSIEHKSILEPLDQLNREGFDVQLLPVAPAGYVEPTMVKKYLRPDTLVVSVMHANNETGILQPVQEIAALLEPTETFFHVDAAQTYGKEVDAIRGLKFDFLSATAHKIYGPQGIGALCIRRNRTKRRPMAPIMFGGGQERGLRPGTLPVPLIVGLGAASKLAIQEHRKRHEHACRLKDELMNGLAAVEHQVNGEASACQAHVLNVSFTGVDSEALMMALKDDVALSNGAACTSSSYSPSHVLKAMSLSRERINSAVRISWGQGMERLPVEPIARAVRSLRT